MAEISLQNVAVDFPVYDFRRRSLRHSLTALNIGGQIFQAEHQKVSIKALDEVTLRFTRGDRVGLVGHNGAGKSTLLRVMAGIYEPVRGSISLSGSVAPLFDVTLGMDPDLTGYENVLLRGLFLGMSRRQIEAKLDDIAGFSELGDFMHMPIRTYSTGMLVRLGFAVSTSTRPDILLMDEMIGAGDAAFFARAQERLHNFIDSASIMVLASHSESVIQNMCNKAVLLHHGRVDMIGPVEAVMARYAEIDRR